MRLFMREAEAQSLAFAERAAAFFAEDERHQTFTDDEIEGGVLFAVRWGTHERAVLVFRLDEMYEPRIYGDLVPRPEDPS